MKRIKVFFIINTFSAGGGAETLMAMIVNALFDSGRYEIGVMEIIHNKEKEEQLRDGIQIYPFYTEAEASDRKQKMYYVYHEWDKVISEYIPDDYDLYISFNYLKPSFLLPEGKKSISWIHGDVYNLDNRYPGQRDMSEERELQRKAFKKVSRIVAISENTRQSIIDVFPEFEKKINTIYNGIDTERIVTLSKANTDKVLLHPAIVYIGRLEKGKDPLRTLEIFNELKKKKEDVHLYYLGYGELSENVKEEVKKRGIEENVHLLGYLQNPFPVIKQADVTIMTSRSEGFPMSLLESVTLNVPFVSTDVGGSRELACHNSCGLVFKDNEEAVDGMISYLEKDKTEIEKITDNAIRQFSLENYISKIEDLFDEVLNDQT